MTPMSGAGWFRLIATAMLIAGALPLAWMHRAEGAVAPDKSRGQQLVEAWCKECHSIDGSAVRTDKNAAPDLRKVANMPSTTALSLKVFLNSSHTNMPNVIIQPSDADEIVHYILGLKRD
jgi:mono/diheme cytochrome c family protein